jgi:DNA-directed RNA polymerase subunit RPC12/RpoP
MGNKTFDVMFTENTKNEAERVLRCQNCRKTFLSTKHINSYTKCPYCNMKNGPERRIIFYYDLRKDKIGIE